MTLIYRPLCGATARHRLVCGEGEIDKWFRNKAWSDHEIGKHITTCARFDPDDDVMGFYTLSTVVEDAKNLPGMPFFSLGGNHFPCLQLVYLAVDKPHQRQGHGRAIIGELILKFAQVGDAVGIPAMIVAPINDDAKRLYVDMGFEPYSRHGRMFMPLKTAVATLREIETEAETEAPT